MLRKNFLKEKLNAGKTVIGTWSVIPSPIVADILAESGLDFIIIDREHGPVNFETAQSMAMACESRGVSPLIRVGGPEGPEILRALETGAHGLHVPNIHNVQNFEDLIAFSKYPPVGQRGFSPFTRAAGYSHLNSKKMQAAANKATLLAVHIEDPASSEMLEAILESAEADVFFVGLFDLSKALGVPGQIEHVRVQKVFRKIVEKIRRAHKVPGTIVTSEAQLKKMLSHGVRYITYSADCEMFLRGYQSVQHEFKKFKPSHR